MYEKKLIGRAMRPVVEDVDNKDNSILPDTSDLITESIKQYTRDVQKQSQQYQSGGMLIENPFKYLLIIGAFILGGFIAKMTKKR